MSDERPLPDLSPEDSLAAETLPDGHRSGFVAVVGRPNVGKSTLLNTFMHQKLAIVTPRPQTTRVRQLGILTTDDYQIVLIDTPGLMKPRHALDAFMVATATDSLANADVILWLLDASESIGPGDRAIGAQLAPLAANQTVIMALNKVDLLGPEEVMAQSEAYRALLPGVPWILFSALKSAGTDELLEMMVAALPEGPRFYPRDQITNAYMRDIAAELVREQVLLQLRNEIPYGVAVQIEEFKERDNGAVYVGATVYVERENHKRIVIGAGGKQLRQIGERARKEIAKLVEGPVFLELWVKAEPKWRRSERALKRFGYSSDG